jgi:hypothetical protein
VETAKPEFTEPVREEPAAEPIAPAATQATAPAVARASAFPTAVNTTPATAATAPPATAATAGSPAGRTLGGFRRGSRGPTAGGPPPILPGQSIAPKIETTASRPVEAAEEAAPVTPPASASDGAPSQAEVVDRIAAYKGVGRKSAEAIVQAFGHDQVFNVLRDQPDRVRQTLGGRRAELLIKGWQQENAPADAQQPEKPPRKGATKRGKKGDQIEAFNESGARRSPAKSESKTASKTSAKKTARGGARKKPVNKA